MEILCKPGMRQEAQSAVLRALDGWSASPTQSDPLQRELDAHPPAGTRLAPREAHALARTLLNLPGVEDVEPSFEVTSAAWSPEEPAAAVKTRARAAADPGADPEWSVRMVKAREAWALSERSSGLARGEGIIVAHPDSGYLDHPELPPRFRPQQGYDFVRARNNPLNEDGAHGLSTSSVLASADNRHADGPGRQSVTGVAPGATVIPYCVTRRHLGVPSPVLFEAGTTRLSQALWRAVEDRADVVSISLGWFGSGRLERAIQHAVSKDLIVVAAAGNYTGPVVVWPAHYREAIAMAACDASSKPWAFSAYGSAVAATGPGHGIWVAGGPYSFRSSGTSYAAATTAGVAALWLAHHGKAALQRAALGIPLAELFRQALQAGATRAAHLPAKRFGAGIVNALDTLALQPAALMAGVAHPMGARVAPARTRAIPAPRADVGVDALADTFSGLPRQAVVDAFAAVTGASAAALQDLSRQGVRELQFLSVLDAGMRQTILAEGATPAAGRRGMRGTRPPVAGKGKPRLEGASEALRNELRALASAPRRKGRSTEPGSSGSGGDVGPDGPLEGDGKGPVEPPPDGGWDGGPWMGTPAVAAYPTREWRDLRVYAFDPGQGRTLGNEAVLRVPFEPVTAGPSGRELVVIDHDPVANASYLPVDLEHPAVLAERGLAPSVSDPRFHQQMVYAVASKTMLEFRRALGRRTRWAFNTRPHLQPRRLQLFPHGLHDQNAFYSRDLNAVMFGSFPSEAALGDGAPGEMVHTCLSHDIVAHELTHALVDGERPHFLLDTNRDAAAFHEAFADLVALFQKFGFVDSTKAALVRTGGALWTRQLDREVAGTPHPHDPVGLNRVVRNPLLDLASQFGDAMGTRRALRSALDLRPDPAAYERATEPHDRGAILVAAVFDAYFTVYGRRNADLIREAARATREGAGFPEWLATRLAKSAAGIAQTFLRICIRALDYCPPVDLTFGDFLRAMITCDADFVRENAFLFRQALVDAFRVRGIVPQGVRSMAEESLCWSPVDPFPSQEQDEVRRAVGAFLAQPTLQRTQPDAAVAWRMGNDASGGLATALHRLLVAQGLPRMAGVAPAPGGKAAGVVPRVAAFRPLPRVDAYGMQEVGVMAELIVRREQPVDVAGKSHTVTLCGGATLILGADGRPIYFIHRSLREERFEEQRAYLQERWKRTGFRTAADGRHINTRIDFQHLHAGDGSADPHAQADPADGAHPVHAARREGGGR
jgi:hypothetical protein